MNIKYILLVIGFVMGILTSTFVYLFINYSNQTSNQNDAMDHSQHMMNGMPSMNSMMKEYSDVEYLNLMIIHHQDALDMANRAIEQSKNEFIQTLSKNIISSQSKEITDMRTEIQKIIESK